MLEVEVQAGNRTASKYSAPGLWELLGRVPRAHWPALLRGDRDWGSEANMARVEHPQSVQGDLPFYAGVSGALTDLLGSDPMADPSGRIPLQPYGLRWLVGEGKL